VSLARIEKKRNSTSHEQKEKTHYIVSQGAIRVKSIGRKEGGRGLKGSGSCERELIQRGGILPTKNN